MLVTYDVNTEDAAGRRRLRRIARACLDWGQRVQYSVFECELDPAQWVTLRARLLGEMDPATDSLRFYRLGAGRRTARGARGRQTETRPGRPPPVLTRTTSGHGVRATFAQPDPIGFAALSRNASPRATHSFTQPQPVRANQVLSSL